MQHFGVKKPPLKIWGKIVIISIRNVFYPTTLLTYNAAINRARPWLQL